MIEKILDLLEKCWTLSTPIVICNAWHGGVVLRFGRVHRVIEPGYHLKWPLLEDYQLTETVTTTMRLPPQTLTTKDGVGVVVSAIVKYRIEDVRPYIAEVWDQKDVLGDVTMGCVRQCVGDMEYAALRAEPPETRIVEFVRRRVRKYGFAIEAVTFVDLGRVRSFRFIQQQTKDLDN